MPSRSRASAIIKPICAAIVPFMIAACAESRPPAPQAAPSLGYPPPAASAAPSTPAGDKEASPDASLDMAETDLNRALARGEDLKKGGPISGVSPEAAGKSPPKGAPPPEDPCATACKALASMTSAASRLCDIAGQGDDRCTNAKTRVQKATSRVHAACPACSG